MNQKLINIWLVSYLVFLGASILLGQQSGSAVGIDQQVNLALRQASHHVYIVAGDSTSKIPAVVKVGDWTYEILLGANLDYDTLPTLITCAFEDFGIKENYYVSVKSCIDSTIILGYGVFRLNILDPPCKGREIDEECTILSVSLQREVVSPVVKSKQGWSSYLVGLGLLGLGLLLIAFRNSKKDKKLGPEANELVQATSYGTISLGTSIFDPRNLTIEVNSMKKDLTYREGKLLSFLVTHRNEVLKRQDIQDHVWEEEGVIVGRSLDVFISRLRKLIKEDQSLKISNIHGVGYRLEEIITQQPSG